jgi:hypothetical protein
MRLEMAAPGVTVEGAQVRLRRDQMATRAIRRLVELGLEAKQK